MAELSVRFETAVSDVKKLANRPSNDDLLSLYAFYKQAVDGDIHGRAPGMFDFKAKAKYDAWKKITGMDKSTAMQSYVSLVERLQQA